MNTFERIILFILIMVELLFGFETMINRTETIISNQIQIISQNKTILVKVGSLYRNQKAPMDGIGKGE